MLSFITPTIMELWRKGTFVANCWLINCLSEFLHFSKLIFSDEHTKLVWVLNLYLIETTSKFVNDVSIISNTVISANNILKRTSNIDQYLSILHVSSDALWLLHHLIRTAMKKSVLNRSWNIFLFQLILLNKIPCPQALTVWFFFHYQFPFFSLKFKNFLWKWDIV